MKSVTVDLLIEREIEEALGHLIYVVRDGRFTFYIGQSKRDVITRFHEHLHKPSLLGQIIQLNLPDSRQWLVDFYTLADCRPFIKQKSLFPMQAWEHFDMDMAEIAMIKQLRPILNQDFNPNPTPLPDRYLGHSLLHQPMPASPIQNQSLFPRIWLNRMSLNGWTVSRDHSGHITWQHHSGLKINDGDMIPFRDAGKLPPLNFSK
jgi:hypothetical protein